MAMIALLYHGPNYQFDDANYIMYARQIINDTFTPFQSPYAYGYMLPATVALSFALLGQSPFTASIPAMIEYGILIIISYGILLKVYENKYAFVGALMLALSAFIIAYSSRVLPDMLAGDIIGLACFFMLSKKSHHALFSGMTIGSLIFIKLGVLLITPMVFIVLLIYRPRIRVAWFAIGFIVLIVAYFGSIGWQFNIISSYGANQVRLSTSTHLVNALEAFLTLPLGLVQNNQTFTLGFLVLLTFAGTVIAFRKRNTLVQQFSLIFLLFYLFMFFGTESIHSYVAITVVSRYFIWVAIPMVIVAVYCVEWLVGKLKLFGVNQYFTLTLVILGTIMTNSSMLWFFIK